MFNEFRFKILGGANMTLAKARRGPFHWRLLTQRELAVNWPSRKLHGDSRVQYGVFSRQVTYGLYRPPVEMDLEWGYTDSQETAVWLADKWNTEAALLLMTEGTAAHQQVAKELYGN